MTLPKWSEAYIGYIAGVVSVAILGWMYWRSQMRLPVNTDE